MLYECAEQMIYYDLPLLVCLLVFCDISLTVVIHMLKFVDLRKTPSLEFGMMLFFSYAPYCLAEGIHLSGTTIGISVDIMLKLK